MIYITLPRFFLILLLWLALAACQPAPATPLPATPVPLPTATPLPPELAALLDRRESAIADIESIRSLYNREGYDPAELDRGLRSLVPTVQALDAALAAAGVQAPPYPLPPTPPLKMQATSYDLGLVSEDGVRLRATFYGPGQSDAPAVLLLHMWDGRRQDWAPFAAQLQAAGYGVLALDLRGHGESEGERDAAAMTQDAAVGVKLLRAREEIDGDRIFLIGASIGANVALTYAAADAGLRGVALLSPGEVYRGVSAPAALAGYGDRPLFIAASREDTYAAASARALAGDRPILLLLEGQGHGVQMLGKTNGLAEALLAWLGDQ